MTIDDVLAVEMRQDETLWATLREVFFSEEDLDCLGMSFVGHVCDLAQNSEVAGELQYAVCALEGRFDLLPPDERHNRWAQGATEPEKRAALAALWAATARANTTTDKDRRLAKWNEERDFQVSAVRERAGL